MSKRYNDQRISPTKYIDNSWQKKIFDIDLCSVLKIVSRYGEDAIDIVEFILIIGLVRLDE